MAPILLPRVLDGGRPNLNSVGIAYIVLAVLYTCVVALELFLLYCYRSAFCVRIRNISVVFATVALLHVYLIIVILVYPWNGTFPCSAEFWVMSIFLPFGMALFQGMNFDVYPLTFVNVVSACNARVLKAYESQRRLRVNFLEVAQKKRLSVTPKGLYEAWLDLDATAKVYVGTVVGLIVSVSGPVAQPRYRAPLMDAGDTDHYCFLRIEKISCFLWILWCGRGRNPMSPRSGMVCCQIPSRSTPNGVSRIPSIFMQLVWTALVGPFILWKIRKVEDVHSWAWQTRLAILSG